MVHSKGFGKLTMRRLAEELNVTPAAMYYHVRGKAELARLVADAVMETIELPDRGAGDWDERIRRLAIEISNVLSDYAGIASLIAQNDDSQSQRRLIDYFVDALQEAGFSHEEATHAYEAIRVYALGEFLGVEKLVAPRPRRHGVAVSRTDASQPEHAEVESRSRFLYGIDLLLAGLKAELETTRSSPNSVDGS